MMTDLAKRVEEMPEGEFSSLTSSSLGGGKHYKEMKMALKTELVDQAWVWKERYYEMKSRAEKAETELDRVKHLLAVAEDDILARDIKANEQLERAEKAEAEQQCNCRQCLRDKKEENPPGSGWPTELTMMILCPTCRNKRCPHATDHRHACTGSNEPGQPGSAYAELVRRTHRRE